MSNEHQDKFNDLRNQIKGAAIPELPKEAEWKRLEAKRRNPLSDVLGSFQSEPMFPYIIEAWDYYVNKVLPEHRTAHGFFKYLLELERGIELRNQKYQPV